MGTNFFELHRWRRMVFLAVVYTVITAASYYLAYELRFDFVVPVTMQEDRLMNLWLVVGLKLVVLTALRQLHALVGYFSVPDLKRIVFAMTVVLGILLLERLVPLMGLTVPRGVLLIDYVLSVAGLCIARLGGRLYRERITLGQRLHDKGIAKASLAIIGAGDAGASLARDFLNTPARGFRPVVFFDDNDAKRGQLIHGVPVMGRPELIGTMAKQYEITKAVIAMPSAPAKRVREIVALMADAGITVETLPAIEELASGLVRASRVRPVEIQDLLGREQVDLDANAIHDLVAGKVVMVTGAGGSIGSELCRQIIAHNPSRLLMVEQAEGSLFYAERQLAELGAGASAVPLVADILDAPRMRQIFARFRPAVVYHAAAHKHVYMMERQPAEAVHNNALGTRRLARLATEHGAEAFVLISTDKAINPTSVMGATKRLAELELQCLHAEGGHQTKLMAVRFGNVLGSSGSVIPIFKEQIARGGPVTVTHPDVTRYFMTIPEAVGLVLQCSVQGNGGEIFVLDMGHPIKIVDLAKQMITLSGYRLGEDIEIKFTGLKLGEKMFEELQHHTEKHQPTRHPRIMRFVSDHHAKPCRDLEELVPGLYDLDNSAVKQLLKELVIEYTPQLD